MIRQTPLLQKIISCTKTFLHSLLCLGLSYFVLSSTLYTAGMPEMNDQQRAEFEKFLQDLEKPEMQQFLKDFEKEFNELPPEVQEELNRKAMEDLQRLGIDPYTYQPTPPTPSAPQKIQPSVQPTPQLPPEPSSDCSQVSTHSAQQASSLLQNTISYLDIVRQKLGLINHETTTIQEWLSAIAYYLKMMNKPEQIKRLTSITFAHLFDLITELEALLRTESNALIILAGEEESRSDDPYAILGIPYDITDEELNKVYEQKMAANNPQTIKQELEQSNTDLNKINKRMRQATLRQATFTDAYEQLHDTNLRQQLDRYRSHGQQQQLALRSANIEAAERLYDALNGIIQQGLIKELEDFFVRYNPTELNYHQQMEEAEKNRFAEQRTSSGLNPMPSPLGGGFPFGGYQPQSYYPNNNYFPQSYQPSFSPYQAGGTGGSSTSGSAGSSTPNNAQPGGSDKTKGEKNDKKESKETKKVDEKKKTEKEKKKKKADGIEQIKKEFAKNLDALKGPMNDFKDYITAEEQEEVRSSLKRLAEPPTRAGRAITDDSFRQLHEGLTTHINPSFTKKFETILQFIGERLMPNQIPNQKAIEACRPVWEAHYKSHRETYHTFDLICKHAMEAYQKDRHIAEQIPWVNIFNVCGSIDFMKQLFKKPETKDTNEKSSKEKEEKNKSSESTSSRESKEKAQSTLEQAQNAVKDLKAAYDEVEQKLQANNEKLNKFGTSFTEAISAGDVEGVKRLKNKWDKHLDELGFNALKKLRSILNKIKNSLSDTDKKTIEQLIRNAKFLTTQYPLIKNISVINKEINRFLKANKRPPADLPRQEPAVEETVEAQGEKIEKDLKKAIELPLES
jgi:hypothetical protein